MTTFKYFGYGSNMLLERLIDRCETARKVSNAFAIGYRLEFSKRSQDGSGKATIWPAEGEIVPGVLFEISESERTTLNEFEGLNKGYEHPETFSVISLTAGQPVSATTYIVMDQHRDTNLQPYDWYHTLVIAGARTNNLPVAHQEWINRIDTNFDKRPKAQNRREAFMALSKAEIRHELPYSDKL